MEDQSSAITFNALKHHLSFLQEEISEWKKLPWPAVREELQKLGTNQYDVYTGNLEVSEILKEAGEFVAKQGIRNRPDFRQWLGKQGYKTILLSDGTRWIIRESDPGEGFAHLHPARNQPDVTRVKANHVKTAVAMILEDHSSGPKCEELTTPEINRLRRESLGLSPVRSLEESRRIMETLRIIAAPNRHP